MAEEHGVKSDPLNRRDFLRGSVGVSLAAAAATGAAASGGAGATPVGPRRSATGAELAGPFNDKIMGLRQAALEVLKPSKKDLEHGLELHANSLVFDTYGFAPRSAVDGEALEAAAAAGASDVQLMDMREDSGQTRCVEDATERAEFLEAWRSSGVTCIFQNAGEEGQDIPRMIKRLARFTYITDFLRDHVSKAATPDDIVAAHEAGRHCLYFTTNGVPLTQEWNTISDELRYLRTFFQFGVRMVHLTYNRRNMIGDGCGEANDAGLSDFGRAAVAALNRVGIIPDCAHSGWKTSLDAAKASSKPMVASHTVAVGVNNHYRGKPDEVIKAIADGGGLVGICCIQHFLGGEGDLAALLDHVDYVAKKFGVDHVGIGTDVAYASRTPSNTGGHGRRSQPRFAALWPPSPRINNPRGRASIEWTNWPLYTVGLVQRGYSDGDIQKIIGQNMLRVCRAALA